MVPNVFISYNTKDRSIASEIATFLAADNINVWFDEWKVTLGDSLINEVQVGLECSHFIFLISKNISSSKFQKRESQSTLARFIQKGSPKIIPIILDDSEPPALLTDIKNWKYEGGTERDREWIIKSITGKLPSQNFIRAIVKKYHEVIEDTAADLHDPLPFKACPECGSMDLERNSYTDYLHDETYFIISCSECDWQTWSQ